MNIFVDTIGCRFLPDIAYPIDHNSRNPKTMVKYKNDGSGRLHGRVAIVTGSSSGMGRAIALGLAREGACVICSDLKPEAASAGFEADKDIPTHEVIRNAGGKSSFTKCDMSITQEIWKLVEDTVKVSRACVTKSLSPTDFRRHSQSSIYWSITLGFGCLLGILSRKQTRCGIQ